MRRRAARAATVAALAALLLAPPLLAQGRRRSPPAASGGAAATGPAPGVSAPTNPVAPPGQVAHIAVGQSMAGELEPGDRLMADSTLADVWELAGAAGQTVTIELRSDEFDTYLLLLDPGGKTVAEDDDSGGDLNSRLVTTLAATGTYRIVVNSAGHDPKAGRYTLSVR